MAELSKNRRYFTFQAAAWMDPKTGRWHVTAKDPFIRKLGIPGMHLTVRPDSATELSIMLTLAALRDELTAKDRPMQAVTEIDLVVNEGETIDDAMRAVLSEEGMPEGLTYEVKAEHGPGGGNPAILVKGSEVAIELFERKWQEGIKA